MIKLVLIVSLVAMLGYSSSAGLNLDLSRFSFQEVLRSDPDEKVHKLIFLKDFLIPVEVSVLAIILVLINLSRLCIWVESYKC